MDPAPLAEELVFNPSLIQSISNAVLPVPALKTTPKLLLYDVPPGQFALLLGGVSGGKPSDISGVGCPSKAKGSGTHSNSRRNEGAKSSEHVGRNLGMYEQWPNNAKKQRDCHNSSFNLRLCAGRVKLMPMREAACRVDNKQSLASHQQRIRRNSCNGRYPRHGRTRWACDGRPARPPPRVAQRRDGGRSSADP